MMLAGSAPSRRNLFKSAAAVGLGAALTRCSALGWTPAGRFDAIVARAAVPGRENVPVYPALSAALDAAPADGKAPFRILLTKGEWRERNVVTKPFVHLIGEGRGESIVVFDRPASYKGPDGKAVATFGTATLVVRAPDFQAAHLTISNDFDYVHHMPPPVPDDQTGASGAQAVAFALEGDADRSFFDDVHFYGYQDTLYTDAGRSLFRNCQIDGCVDFIFGRGRVVFERCDILSKLRPGQDFQGYIVGPDTDRSQPVGYVFVDCRLLREKGIPPHSVALGRPWRHTRTFPDGRYGDPDAIGATAYIRCWMDGHIVPEGWYPMGYNLKGGGRGMMQPEEARFFEFESCGPGKGVASARRRQLTADEARAFAPDKVLQGWRPASGV